MMIDQFTNQVFDTDAIEFMKMLPDDSIDMGLFDLPYGATCAKWDTVIDIDAMWQQLKRVAKPKAALVFTATQPFSSRLVSSNYDMYQYSWIWEKTRKTNFLNAAIMPLSKHEDILIFGNEKPRYFPQMKQSKKHTSGRKQHKGSRLYGDFNANYLVNRHEYFPSSVLKIPHDGEASVTYKQRPNKLSTHPTQKPIALFEYLIKTYTQSGEIVLDITCGSGTTGIACTNLDRRYILGDNGVSERTGERWSDIARNRIQAHDPMQATLLKDGSKQLSLFSQE